MKKWIITALALAGTAAAIVVFLPKRGEVVEATPPLVEVAEVSRHSVSRSVELVGYVAPVRQTAAVARAYGKVTRISVTEGQRVGKDQVLLTLQPDEVGLTYNPQPVKAPIAGVVAEVMVKEGEPVAPGTPVASIVDPSRVEVEVAVAGEYHRFIRPADRAFLLVENDTIPARVKSKAPVVDPLTRTFSITLSPERASGKLVSGLSVTVRLILEQRTDVLAVPNQALRDAKLLVVKGDSVEQRSVRLGLVGLNYTEILEGVKAGEVIVTFGGENLTTGQRVRVR